MQILKLDAAGIPAISANECVTQAVAVLRAGGLILFPTETVYGAGVDATNPEAVAKLLAYKSKREGKPLSIAVTDIEMAQKYVELNESAKKMYARFLPGPVTVVSKARQNSALVPGVISEFGTVGVRIPAYDLIHDIVKALGKPMTATSANASGKKRPHSIADVFEGLSGKQKGLIDLVIDAGILPPNEPSTVIDTTLSTPITLRSGAIDAAGEKERAAGEETTTLTTNSESETKMLAGKLLLKYWNTIRSTGLVIGLDGSLGTGKTIFAKGVADFLGIKETITSPTYSYIQEYEYERHGVTGTFFHLDVWKIDTAEQAKLLEIPSLIKPNSVVVIEWWEQIKQFEKFEGSQLNQKNLLQIKISDLGEQNQTNRTITITEQTS